MICIEIIITPSVQIYHLEFSRPFAFILPKTYFHGLNLLVVSSDNFNSMFQHSPQIYPFERTTSTTKQNKTLKYCLELQYSPSSTKYFTVKIWGKVGYTHHYYALTILTHPLTKSHLSSFYLTSICPPHTTFQ